MPAQEPSLTATPDLDPAAEQPGLLVRSSRFVALLAAWIATCGSLFLSEVLGYLPCELCWYQRILMYPLAVVLLVAVIRRDDDFAAYVLPFSGLGMLVSTYHYLLIKTDLLPTPNCMAGVSCKVDYIDWWGVVNIPFMALTAFTLVTLMTLAWQSLRPLADEWPARPSLNLDRMLAGLLIVLVLLGFGIGATFV